MQAGVEGVFLYHGWVSKPEAPNKPVSRHPEWLRVRLPADRSTETWLKEKLDQAGLHTVCQEARCPNLHDCFSRRSATFLLMGDVCTRTCSFCAIAKGTPGLLDGDEPEKLSSLVAEMGLRYVVLTSVNRDDLPDGGAGHFVRVIEAIRQKCPGTLVEVLTPDFAGDLEAVSRVAAVAPAVYNHNVETVPRLYKRVRPGSVYERSLTVLKHVADTHPDVPTKSGLMVGLGEREEEVVEVMRDLRASGVRLLSIGQYLAPQNRHLRVESFVAPETFDRYRAAAKDLGFLAAHVAPFARSSFHADELHDEVTPG